MMKAYLTGLVKLVRRPAMYSAQTQPGRQVRFQAVRRSGDSSSKISPVAARRACLTVRRPVFAFCPQVEQWTPEREAPQLRQRGVESAMRG